MAPSKNPAVRLAHIRDELTWLLPRFQGMEYDEFSRNVVYVRAAERALLIISEAVKALPEELLASYPEIPWHSIRGIGNFLRHEYELVDHRVVWQTVTMSLPKLAPVVDGLLREHGPLRGET